MEQNADGTKGFSSKPMILVGSAGWFSSQSAEPRLSVNGDQIGQTPTDAFH
jgi:hypothetical protein